MNDGLQVTHGKAAGTSIPLEPGEFLIGRAASGPGTLGGDPELSREHARLTRTPDGTLTIEDLGSTNGTYVNDQLLTGTRELQAGDSIQLGTTTLKVAGGESPFGATRIGSTRMPGAATATGSTSGKERAGGPSRKVLGGIAAAVLVIGAAVAGILALTGSGGEDATAETTTQLSAEQLIDRSQAGAIRLRGRDQLQQPVGGTAIVLDAKAGLAMTNSHVVAGLSSLQAIIRTGDALERVPARVEAHAPCDDLALVSLRDPPEGLKQLKLASKLLKRGERVIALGYPIALQGSRKFSQSTTLVSTDGTVSVPKTAASPSDELPRYSSLVQHTAALNPGNSGGPLLNERGEVVGVNTLGSGDSVQGQFYAISAERIRPVVDRLKKGDANEYVGWGLVPNSLRADLGFGDDVLRKQGVVGQKSGLLNVGSDPASPAATRFEDGGDTILSIQGTPVDTIEQTCAILRSQRPGARLSIRGVDADGERFSTNITLQGRE